MAEVDISVAAMPVEVPMGFGGVYTVRYPDGAPDLDERFDERGQALYGGFDPKTAYRPATDAYPDAPEEELVAAADALTEHGMRCLSAARTTFSLGNVVWLGLANKNEVASINMGGQPDREATAVKDEHGLVTRVAKTDIGVAGPRDSSSHYPLTIAMGVADCLAVPIVDMRTGAFAFAHAGRPGTSLHTTEIATNKLIDTFGSRPEDLTAKIQHGVCANCHVIDEKALDEFIKNFGGKSQVDKVLASFPDALEEVEADGETRYAIDLNAFNIHMLEAKRIGDIAVATVCTARLSEACDSVSEDDTTKKRTLFNSHMRDKSRQIGWRMDDGEVLEFTAKNIGTPRNLATLTRW